MRPVDRLLIAGLPKTAPRFLVTGLDPDGELGLSAAARHPSSKLLWFSFDLFAAGIASSHGLPPERVALEADLPGSQPGGPAVESIERPDLVALPLPRGGDALLGRELIEEAHDALVLGGRLLAATDGDPGWLKKVVREVFRNAEVTAGAGGAVVSATRRGAATALKDHSHVARLEHGGRAFEFRTRPGVFSYGHVDQGSKALLSVADFSASHRILDIGCGYGVLGIVGAASSPGASAVLVDSNVRAIALARENAARNAAADVSAVASADPLSVAGGPFDCVVANPPYFASFRIAARFIEAAREQLGAGGRLWLVAKAAEEHAELVRRTFGNADLTMRGDYGVVSAVAT